MSPPTPLFLSKKAPVETFSHRGGFQDPLLIVERLYYCCTLSIIVQSVREIATSVTFHINFSLDHTCLALAVVQPYICCCFCRICPTLSEKGKLDLLPFHIQWHRERSLSLMFSGDGFSSMTIPWIRGFGDSLLSSLVKLILLFRGRSYYTSC